MEYTLETFVGCLLYAYDIMLLSGSCHGLQNTVEICSRYGCRFDIRFNPLKSQTTVFSGRALSHSNFKLNQLIIPYVDKISGYFYQQ